MKKNESNVIIDNITTINYKYQCIGIIEHIGNAYGDYYYSIVHQKNKWYNVNDEIFVTIGVLLVETRHKLYFLKSLMSFNIKFMTLFMR